MNTSLIITVLNEAQTIQLLLDSILKQTVLPQEVIIVDGGSTDDTVKKIQQFANKTSVKNKVSIIVVVKKGNRSVGRNYAVSLAKNKLLAITDAGCELDKNWLKELLEVYSSQLTTCPVIAGYYSAKPQSDFQNAVVPYVLVMPDRVDPKNFLPATRSMLIEKKVFETLGGFDTELSDNEDYAFAKKLQQQKIDSAFARKAIVYWHPTETLAGFYNMIFRFARGDMFAGILRPKVMLIFLRYCIFGLLLAINVQLFLLALVSYCLWAIQKNKKYVSTGWKFLPVLQITSDIAVMHGSILGFMRRNNFISSYADERQ